MSAFDLFQLLIDLAFVGLLLLLILGRGWRRGPAGAESAAEQETYREMISTLTMLIKEMKQAGAEMQEQLGAKQVEVSRAIAAADERLRHLEGAVNAPLELVAPPRASATQAARTPSPAPIVREVVEEARMVPSVAAAPPASPEVPRPASSPEPAVERTLDDDDRDRAEKYRQVMEFAEKGWSSLDIARFLQVPRGEVDLLMRTKIRGKE